MPPKKKKSSKKKQKLKKSSSVPVLITPDDVGKKVKELISKITKYSQDSKNFEKTFQGISLKSIITQMNYIEAQFKEIKNKMDENQKNDPILSSKQAIISLNNEIQSLENAMEYKSQEIAKNNMYKSQILRLLTNLEKDAFEVNELKSLLEKAEEKTKDFAKAKEFRDVQTSIQQLNNEIEEVKEFLSKKQVEKQENDEFIGQVTEVDILHLKATKRELDKELQNMEQQINEYEKINSAIVTLTQIKEQISFIKEEIMKIDQLNQENFTFMSENDQNSEKMSSASLTQTNGSYTKILDTMIQKFDEIHDSVYKYSRFFGGILIITPKEIDEKIEKAKALIENVYQITNYCTNKAKLVITGSVVQERMTQLAQLVSSIEQKIQNFTTHIDTKTDLTVEMVNSKIKEYITSSNAALSYVERIEKLTEKHENIINSIKQLKNQSENQRNSIQSLRTLLKTQNKGNNLSNISIEQKLAEIEDTIAMTNALCIAVQSDHQNDLKEFREKTEVRLSYLEERLANKQNPQQIQDMINNTVAFAKTKQFSPQEINFAKKQSDTIAEYFDEKLTPKVNAFKKEVMTQFGHIGSDASIMKQINTNRLKFIQQINEIAEKSIKPNVLVQTVDDFEILRQNRANELKEANNDFINEIPEEKAPITKKGVELAKTKIKELPRIEKQLQFVGTKAVPVLTQMQKGFSQIDNSLKQIQNGSKQVKQIQDPFIESKDKEKPTQKFDFEEQQKKADALLQYYRPRSEMSLKDIEKSLQHSKTSFEEFKKIALKVNNMEQIQAILNSKVENAKTQKKVVFSSAEKAYSAKKLPELQKQLQQIKQKIKNVK